MRKKKTLRIAAFSLLILGLALFLYGRVIWNQYLDTLPKTIAPQAKHVVPLNIHGIVVYQTVEERNWLWLFDRGGIIVFFIGLVVGGFSEKLKE